MSAYSLGIPVKKKNMFLPCALLCVKVDGVSVKMSVKTVFIYRTMVSNPCVNGLSG